MAKASARNILVETKEACEKIKAKILGGADFAEMARQHSEGPSSDNGGDLGRFQRGRMVPAFEEAAFSQEVDAIGPLVETQFGYHIIKVHSHVEAGQAPREEVVELLTRRNQSEALRQYVLKLMEAADITYADAIAPNIPPSIKP